MAEGGRAARSLDGRVGAAAAVGVGPPNKAVAHALSVLDLFADGSTLLGVSEISRSVGLDKSTVSRIVATLAHHGYLSRSEDGRRYEVGPTAWLVGMRYRLGLLLAETARVAMVDVLRRFPGTTGYTGVRYKDQVCYIAVVDGSEAQRVHLELSERTPMARIALGRAMLAHLPADDLTGWLTRLTPQDLPGRFRTRGELLDELDRVRAQGYAINEGDHDPEIGAVAAPVFTGDGTLLGGIAVDFMLRDATPELAGQLGPAVITTAAQIQRILAVLK